MCKLGCRVSRIFLHVHRWRLYVGAIFNCRGKQVLCVLRGVILVDHGIVRVLDVLSGYHRPRCELDRVSELRPRSVLGLVGIDCVYELHRRRTPS